VRLALAVAGCWPWTRRSCHGAAPGCSAGTAGSLAVTGHRRWPPENAVRPCRRFRIAMTCMATMKLLAWEERGRKNSSSTCWRRAREAGWLSRPRFPAFC